MVETVEQFFDELLPRYFKAEKAGGLSATYLFCISGEGGGKWAATIANSTLTVDNVTGKDNLKPNITITVSAKDWLDIVNGRMDGQMAFMNGKLKVSGDIALGMRLKSIFFS